MAGASAVEAGAAGTSAVVIGALRRTDRSQTAAEKDDYERRIRILRAVLVVMTIGLTPILGFVIGRTLFG